MPTIDTFGAHHADPDETLDAQLAQLEDRLVVQYVRHGHHDETKVRAEFQRARQHVANARVRSFVPILLERAVQAAIMSGS
ncbi:MAG TPA: hypothetical protein VJS67_04430 [Pseudonocardiaceae bacterium]|nr:hypothetical protein [Pseudonocardiaceae bacterium]